MAIAELELKRVPAERVVSIEVTKIYIARPEDVEHTYKGEGIVGMDGAEVNRRMIQAFPRSKSLRDRVTNYGLSQKTPFKAIQMGLYNGQWDRVW